MPSQDVNALQQRIEAELDDLMDQYPASPTATAAINFQFSLMTLTLLGEMPVRTEQERSRRIENQEKIRRIVAC